MLIDAIFDTKPLAELLIQSLLETIESLRSLKSLRVLCPLPYNDVTVGTDAEITDLIFFKPDTREAKIGQTAESCLVLRLCGRRSA